MCVKEKISSFHKQKAPQLSEAFNEREMVFTLCAGPTRLELATSGLTEQMKKCCKLLC